MQVTLALDRLKVSRRSAELGPVDTDLASPGRTTPTCPRCGAAARGQVTWCTQCYHDLTPAPPAGRAARAAADAPSPSVLLTKAGRAGQAGQPGQDGQAAPGQTDPSTSSPTWPCPCGTANSYDETFCADCGDAFLSRLRGDETPSMVLPLVGDVARFSRTQRLLGACGAAFLVSLLLLMVGLLL